MRPILRSLPWLTAPLWLDSLAWWLAYSPSTVISHLGGLLLSVALMFAMCAVAAAVILLIGPLAALSGDHRAWALQATAKAIVFLASFVGGIWLGQLVWRGQVEQVVDQSGPLVAAIHAFSAQNGRPPATLDELTPQNLADVPTTGIGSRPTFRFVVGEPERFDGNPWVLIVDPPCTPMGFDLLMYFPMQNYPKQGYGGWIEPVGVWGYVHE